MGAPPDGARETSKADMQDTQPYRPRAQDQARRIRRAAPRERRAIRWRRWVLLAVMAVAALVGVGAVIAWQRAAALNDAVSTQPAASVRLFGPFSPERINVLLLGYSDESREGAYLSDSMNVLSIDKATDTTSVIAIPRDLWVEGVEEVPQNMKINEAFRIGTYERDLENGGDLAAEAVSQVLGLEVHGWISLDFEGFRKLVDAVGGISLDNPRSFRYTWVESNFRNGKFSYKFRGGTLHLNGKRALDYARARYTNKPMEASDFARSVRQQRVLAALKGKVGLGQLTKLTQALDGHLLTNLSVIDLGILGSNLDIDARIELREAEILEATTNTIGQYVLVTIGRSSSSDYAPLHRYVADELAAPVADPSATPGASP